MNFGTLRILILVSMVAASGLIAILVALVGLYGLGESTAGLIRKSADLVEAIGNRGRETGWYRKKEGWLIRTGAAFHLGTEITPFALFSIKLILGLCSFLAIVRVGFVFGAGFSVFMFFLPEILFSYLNSRDNKKLLPELQLMYRGLELQLKAGVHITQALAECYGCVSERRLKQALLDMTSDLVVHGDIYQALDQLQKKFDNRHIDSLCIIILQAMESGQAVDLLKDLGEQMKDMELIMLQGKKEKLDRSITIYQLGILAAVLGVVIYACVTQILFTAVQL